MIVIWILELIWKRTLYSVLFFEWTVVGIEIYYGVFEEIFMRMLQPERKKTYLYSEGSFQNSFYFVY